MWEKIKAFFVNDKWKNLGKIVIKISPIAISLCALIFSINSYIDSKFAAPLSYTISTENKYVDDIVLDGKKIKGTLPRIVRNSGFINKTTVIVYANKQYEKLSEFPTRTFSNDINFLQKLNLESISTSAGLTEMYSMYSNVANKKYYSYYFLLIEGMDKSKNLHMISHYYDEENKTTLTKNYSEVTIFSPEQGEEYSEAFKNAKEDFFSLKADLENSNAL